MRFTRPASRWRHLMALLAFAVVLTQGLGLIHRTLHGPLAARASASLAHASVPQQEGAAADRWQGLFADHDDESKCRLFDAVGHAGGPASASPLPVVAPAAAVLLWLAGQALSRHAALFEARGPPRFR